MEAYKWSLEILSNATITNTDFCLWHHCPSTLYHIPHHPTQIPPAISRLRALSHGWPLTDLFHDIARKWVEIKTLNHKTESVCNPQISWLTVRNWSSTSALPGN